MLQFAIGPIIIFIPSAENAMPAPFDAYIASIAADLKGGHATEHTYRPALERFMEAVRPGVKASNDPKHIVCGRRRCGTSRSEATRCARSG